MFERTSRALRVLKGLSFDTFVWCVSVIGCAVLLCTSFFVSPIDRVFMLNANVVNAKENTIEVLHNQMNYSSILGSPEKLNNEELGREAISAMDDGSNLSLEDNAGVSVEDFDALCRIVECEAVSEDTVGKIMVANVVLNRIADDEFPDTIIDVIESPGQFDPVTRKSYFVAYPSTDTKEAVMRALNGEDYSEGALFFQKSTCKVWGDKTYLYRHGSHSFYK